MSKGGACHGAEDDRQPAHPQGRRITDDNLGVGGPKQKFARNIEAIQTLRTLEQEHCGATAEEQQVLSQYVGWGGLADAFDPSKENWSAEYPPFTFLTRRTAQMDELNPTVREQEIYEEMELTPEMIKSIRTLCATCLRHFVEAKAFKIALVPSADRSMDTCTVCQTRRGHDYVVMHR